MTSINKALGEARIPNDRLKKSFGYCWPGLHDFLQKNRLIFKEISKKPNTPKIAEKTIGENEVKLEKDFELVLRIIARTIDASGNENDYALLSSVARLSKMNKRRVMYIGQKLKELDLIRVDRDGDFYFNDKGTAYLVENDLI